MRWIRTMVMLLSLLVVQVHGLVPHHHAENPLLVHCHDDDSNDSTPECDLGEEEVHHHLHTHADLADTKVPQTMRLEFDAVNPTSSPEFLIEFPTAPGATMAWPAGEPLTTGPPRHSSGLSPPVPAPIR